MWCCTRRKDIIMVFQVVLNGTEINPYKSWGVTQNPFPQIPKAEYTKQILHLQALGGEPIPDTDYIRNHLKGWSKEFVDLCCERFEKGKMVKFDVAFPE